VDVGISSGFRNDFMGIFKAVWNEYAVCMDLWVEALKAERIGDYDMVELEVAGSRKVCFYLRAIARWRVLAFSCHSETDLLIRHLRIR